MKKRWLALATVGAIMAGGVAVGAAANDVEQPDYEVLRATGNIEIRRYAPMIVAETTVSGSEERARNQGFRILADYIFGNNIAQDKIAMTSPVTQSAQSEKIAMTAPVTQQSDAGEWQIAFVMPAEFTMETLPEPVNPSVTLSEVPGRKMAAIRFSGWGRADAMERREKELRDYLAATGMEAKGDASYAFYDGPWVPGPLRRNEVMIEID